jgi:hypothetical protein
LRLGTHSNFLLYKYLMIYRKLNRQMLKAVAIKQNECLEKKLILNQAFSIWYYLPV